MLTFHRVQTALAMIICALLFQSEHGLNSPTGKVELLAWMALDERTLYEEDPHVQRNAEAVSRYAVAAMAGPMLINR